MIEGKRIPNAVFKTRIRDESLGGENPFRWQEVNSDSIFNDKREKSSECNI